MAGLSRSQISFRRQGSSGLVWDDKLLSASGELLMINIPAAQDHKDQKLHDHHNNPDDLILRRTLSNGGARRAYRTINVEEAADPPSPRLSSCVFCGVFGKSFASTGCNTKSGKPK